MPSKPAGKSIPLPFLFAWLIILPQAVFGANQSGWDCHSEGEEWVCAAEEKPIPTTPTPADPNLSPQTETALASPPKPAPEIRIGQVPTMPKAPAAAGSSSLLGWNCEPDEGGQWRCKLTGPDPQGKPRLVGVRERAWFELPPVFTPQDEQDFFRLIQLLPEDPWAAYCQGQRVRAQPAKSRAGLPLNLEADYSQSLGENLTFFSGNVKIERGSQKLWADALTYDTDLHILNAFGNVIYEEAGNLFVSDSLWLDLENDKARLNRPRFILGQTPARGAASRSRFESEELSRHQQVTYTTCPIATEDWILHARDLKINRASGIASGHHVWLEFLHLPVFYAPYFAHPIDDRRISGFLSPSFGRSSTRGFDFTLPYYFNLAPNYDLTLTPRIMVQRGFMAGMEFRYLLPNSRGRVAGEILPHDSQRGTTRGQGTLFSETQIDPYWSALADINYVSDSHYLNELGNNLSLASNRQIHSEARTEYRRDNWYFLGRLENWQTVDPTIPDQNKPYRRLPQLFFAYDLGVAPWALGHVDSEFVYFQQDKRVDAQRLHLRPSLAFPWRSVEGFFIPKIGLDYTQYWLQGTHPGQDSQISRILPVASLDGGLFFEKDWEGMYQTLEPRVFYLFIPRQNQNDIPVFDSALYDFNFNQLFRDNRFSGYDRINDANQFSVALTSRLIESESGKERLRASLGQIYYLTDRHVTLPNLHAEKSRLSNLVAEVDVLPTDRFSVLSGIQWSPKREAIDRGEILFGYKDGEDRIVGLGYRYRRQFAPLGAIQNSSLQKHLKILDGSFRWLIYPGLHAIGRWQYSLRDDITLDSFLGVEIDSCCWRLRLIGRRFIRDVNRAEDTAVFAQLELKGLVSLGKDVDQFLERTIRGYGTDDWLY
ncbi:MAG: LPS assembly protein LptD [Methylohalobius sp.]|nr:LPS assembly protein LptD [Methylohalobius sp.]